MKKLIILLFFAILIPFSIQKTTENLEPKLFVEVTIKDVDMPYSVDFLI
jgi:predicted cation transporter